MNSCDKPTLISDGAVFYFTLLLFTIFTEDFKNEIKSSSILLDKKDIYYGKQ